MVVCVVLFSVLAELVKGSELAMRPAPRWLDSSVGRALHRYRRGHGFETCSGVNFSAFNFTTA